MKIGKISVIMLFFCTLLLNSCVKDDEKVAFSEQEASIDTYVQSLSERYETYDGVWRVVINEGSNDIFVTQGSQVRIDYSIFRFDRGIGQLIYTNRGASEGSDNWITIGDNAILSGLDIGIVGASLNEICHIIFSARYGFGNIQVGAVPKMSPLLVEVVIKEINTN